MVNHDLRRFPARVDYITSPGYLDGSQEARRRAGLIGGGPSKVITDLAVMDFDENSHCMRLKSVHPGVRAEDVQCQTGFDLLLPVKVETTEPPTDDELHILREIADPTGFYIKRRNARKPVQVMP